MLISHLQDLHPNLDKAILFPFSSFFTYPSYPLSFWDLLSLLQDTLALDSRRTCLEYDVLLYYHPFEMLDIWHHQCIESLPISFRHLKSNHLTHLRVLSLIFKLCHYISLYVFSGFFRRQGGK